MTPVARSAAQCPAVRIRLGATTVPLQMKPSSPLTLSTTAIQGKVPGAAVSPPIIEALAVGEGRDPLAFPVDANRANRPRAISAANKSRFDSRLCRDVSINIVVSGLGLKGAFLDGDDMAFKQSEYV